ncbi:MAG: sugar phosphate nucleotidyltransferase [Candidatus Saccharimonadales bacterium]|nr:sugar phosphate nucleotidyltransferase [Candidatus Saccharimonadales bacterium]
MKILVSTGGQGTKMWPYSRESKPKQFQPIIGDKSSYQQTIETLLKKFSPEDIYISTKHKFIKYISEQSPMIPLRNYIIEPNISLNRGPGEGLAFLHLSINHSGEPFFYVQADILRDPEEGFLQMIDEAEELVTKHKKLITGGIKATEPTMGIDYLRLGDRDSNAREAYAIDEFLPRKKTLKATRELIGDYHVVTHSNHTCWYPELMMDAYKKYRPDWHKALMKIKDVLGETNETEKIEAIYKTMKAGPTEEVTDNVMNSGGAMVVLLPYRWRDIGTWNSVFNFYAGNGENYTDGNAVIIDTIGTLVKTDQKDKLIAVVGADDLVIVDTEDALLVSSKERLEKLSEVHKTLKDENKKQYL